MGQTVKLIRLIERLAELDDTSQRANPTKLLSSKMRIHDLDWSVTGAGRGTPC
jgi:hypothetical protein